MEISGKTVAVGNSTRLWSGGLPIAHSDKLVIQSCDIYALIGGGVIFLCIILYCIRYGGKSIRGISLSVMLCNVLSPRFHNATISPCPKKKPKYSFT